MMYEILIGGRRVAYEIIRKNVKNINLRIYPGGQIKISANPRVPIEVIERFIRSREAFVLKSLDRFESEGHRRQIERSVEENSVIRLFDRELILKIRTGRPDNAVILGDELHLTVQSTEDENIKRKTLEGFLKDELLKRISEILPEAVGCLRKYDVERPEIKVRAMKTRWGSCNFSKKLITINAALAEYPSECLRFVLMHELCHLIHPNHSKEFYNTLTEVMPEWKLCKKMLNGR